MLETSQLSVHRGDSFGILRVIAQSAMGSLGVVVLPSSLDQSLRISQTIEDFSVEHFVAGPGIETLAASVFPR